jgi:uncharacterized protein (DUF2147 family)
LLPSLRLLRPVGLAVLASLLGAGVGMAASAKAPVEGVWRTKLASEVTIAPCAGGYCGYLSKVFVPKELLRPGENIDNLEPKDYRDVRNKDPKLRARALLGLQILTLAAGSRSPDHYDGRIYNPEDGNTYSGSLDMLGNDRLRLNGCALIVFCRGEDWVRVRR